MTPAARREAATYLRRAFEMSERRACRVIGTDRTSVRYQGVRPDDEVLRERLKALAQERRRFGYRRLHVLLRREGHAINKKRVQRLYREERLTVRRRGGRKRAIGTLRPMVAPQAADQRWSLDFVSDQLTDGRRSKFHLSLRGLRIANPTRKSSTVPATVCIAPRNLSTPGRLSINLGSKKSWARVSRGAPPVRLS